MGPLKIKIGDLEEVVAEEDVQHFLKECDLIIEASEAVIKSSAFLVKMLQPRIESNIFSYFFTEHGLICNLSMVKK